MAFRLLHQQVTYILCGSHPNRPLQWQLRHSAEAQDVLYCSLYAGTSMLQRLWRSLAT